jgi:ParB family chromosome partitioning protein
VTEARQIVYLDPNELISDPNVRRQEGDLRGLAATIREFGVLEPLGVRNTPDGYRLVYGNRRRAAAIMVGLREVPCIILEDRAEDDYVIHQLVENLQRRQLGDMEQAEGLATIRRRMAHRDPKLSETELDERVGRLVGLSARTVQRYLSLRELPAEIRDLIQDEELSVSQAQHLRQISQPQRQIELAKVAVQFDLSAAIVRDAVAAMNARRTLTALEAISLGGRVQPLPGPEEAEQEESNIVPLDAAGDNEIVASEDGAGFRVKPRLVRNMGAFDDELDRLVRSVNEGALDRAIKKDITRANATLEQVQALARALEEKVAALGKRRRKGAA